MADDTVNMLPTTQAFGSMTRDQLIALAKNPPRPEAERGGSPGIDPMGTHIKASQLTTPIAAPVFTAQSATNIIGRRAYHRTKKEEVTILAETEKPTVVRVRWDNGDISKVKVENITLL